MRYNFFTYFNIDYINIGMAMLVSLKQTQPEFVLYACAMDDKCLAILQQLQNSGYPIVPVDIKAVEAFDVKFAQCRSNRSRVEYYFTLSPVLPIYLFDQFAEIDYLTYLDADMIFYQDVKPLYEELENAQGSVMITPHGFPEHLKFRESYGIYNVSFQIYKREGAEQLLAKWRKLCIEWCYDILEENRFADQKYLDSFPTEFSTVHVCENPAAGIAPWNWSVRPLEKRIFYHFQGFKFLTNRWACHNLGSYQNFANGEILKVYQDYAKQLFNAQNILKEITGQDLPFPNRHQRSGSSTLRQFASAIRHRNLMRIKN